MTSEHDPPVATPLSASIVEAFRALTVTGGVEAWGATYAVVDAAGERSVSRSEFRRTLEACKRLEVVRDDDARIRYVAYLSSTR
jgi:hypothetical protein